MKKTSYLLLFLLLITSISAQVKPTPPIPYETLFGDKRAVLTFAINKQIEGKFHYSNITSAATYYDFRPATAEVVSVNSFLYQFNRLVGAGATMQYHFYKGFVPGVSASFSYANPTWLLLFNPYYNFKPWSNLETVGIVEYKPQVANNLRLFTRVQGFYGYDFEQSQRERAMLYLRLGMSYKKYTVGFGTNYDYYIPQLNSIQNTGAFFRVDI